MRGVHQMLVERETALPERHALFGVDELVVERDAREHRTDRQDDERDQHRTRAFVRVIARGAVAVRIAVARVRMLVARMFIGGIFMLALHPALDMLPLFHPPRAITGTK